MLSILLAASAFTVINTIDLEPPLQRTRDIRWKDQNTVLVATVLEGVRQIDVGPSSFQISDPVDSSCFEQMAWRLGSSNGNLVVGAPSREITWKLSNPRECVHWFGLHELNWIADLDLNGDRLLWIGASEKDNLLCPDGATAWVANLNLGADSKTPVHFAQDGAGSPSMNNCGVFQTSLVRFLEDGWFVIVPGVEPGVFLYTDTGRLHRTWRSEELGVETTCDLDYETSTPFMTDQDLRYTQWINLRRVVDEILPMGDRIGLVVREVVDDRTSWDLFVLSRDGTVQQSHLPIKGSSDRAHIKGDVLGTRIALVVYHYISEDEMGARLVILEVQDK